MSKKIFVQFREDLAAKNKRCILRTLKESCEVAMAGHLDETDTPAEIINAVAKLHGLLEAELAPKPAAAAEAPAAPEATAASETAPEAQ